MENISLKEFILGPFKYKLIETDEQMKYYCELANVEVNKRRKERENRGVKPLDVWTKNDFGFSYIMFRKSDNTFLGLLRFFRAEAPDPTIVYSGQRAPFTSESSASRRLLICYILLNTKIFNVNKIICNRVKVLVDTGYYQDFSNEVGNVYDVCRMIPVTISVSSMKDMAPGVRNHWGEKFKDEPVIKLIFSSIDMQRKFGTSDNFIKTLVE